MHYRGVHARFRVPVLVVALVLALVAAPGAVGPDVTTTDGDAIGPTTVAAAQADNETTRHRNPAEYAEDGDQEALAEWFERELSERLGNSTIALSQGQYDLASEYVGEEYREQFGDYVDVAGNTGREETAEQFEEVREEQANLTETRQEYDETYEAYEDARQAGDDQRARELARELEGLYERINASTTALSDHYDAIEADAGVDLQAAQESVAAVDREVTETQATIREAEFETTQLTVRRTDDGPISFSDPMQATGTLETTAGDPIVGETVRLAVGNRTLTVTTDASGSFSFTYRPLSLPVTVESVPVTYVPEGSSVYLGSETSVPATVEAVEPTIEPPTTDAGSVAFGDDLGVASSVTVDGEPVTELPLVVRLGGEPLGLVRTGDDGALSGSLSIPASVPDGERELTVAIPFEDRALDEASVSTPVTVEETPSSVSVEASRSSERVVVNGTVTAAGAGVAEQSVTIAVDGESLTTTETADDGSFGVTVALPESASGKVSITASTDGSGTNLEPAEASDVVSVPGGSSPRRPFVGIPTWVLGAIGGSIIVTLTAGWWLWRRSGLGRDTSDKYGLPTSMETESDAPSAGRSNAVLLSRAADELRAGRPDEAVRAAYAAVRRHLGGDRTDVRTHWEFYREYASTGDDADDLRELTEDYERATFGPEPIGSSTAERAISMARDLSGLDSSVDDDGESAPGAD